MSLSINASSINSNYSTTLPKINLSIASQSEETSDTDETSATMKISSEGLAASKEASSTSSSESLSGLTESQLNDLVEAGTITAQEVAAELARREAAAEEETVKSSSQMDSKIAVAFEAYKIQTALS